MRENIRHVWKFRLFIRRHAIHNITRAFLLLRPCDRTSKRQRRAGPLLHYKWANLSACVYVDKTINRTMTTRLKSKPGCTDAAERTYPFRHEDATSPTFLALPSSCVGVIWPSHLRCFPGRRRSKRGTPWGTPWRSRKRRSAPQAPSAEEENSRRAGGQVGRHAPGPECLLRRAWETNWLQATTRIARPQRAGLLRVSTVVAVVHSIIQVGWAEKMPSITSGWAFEKAQGLYARRCQLVV